MNEIMTNSISFFRENNTFKEWANTGYDDVPFTTTAVLIDNKNLIEHLREYELPLASKIGHPEIAGLYIGGDPSDPLECSNLFKDFSQKSSIGLFQCKECMSATCPCYLVFNIHKEGSYVYWDNFHQEKSNYLYTIPSEPFQWTSQKKKNPPSHNSLMETKINWDYSKFGPFIFLEKDYLSELEKLQKTIKM